MDGFCDLVGTDVAPVSKKAAVNDILATEQIVHCVKFSESHIFVKICKICNSLRSL